MNPKRRSLLIDRPVQIGLVLRIVFHWLAFLAAVVVVLPLYRAIVQGDIVTPMSVQASKAAVDGVILFTLFLALLPYFIYDTFKITNRFAGPMYRLHRQMRELGHGKKLEPVHFRKGDYWHDVAKDFNAMVDRLQNGGNTDAGDKVEEEAAAV